MRVVATLVLFCSIAAAWLVPHEAAAQRVGRVHVRQPLVSRQPVLVSRQRDDEDSGDWTTEWGPLNRDSDSDLSSQSFVLISVSFLLWGLSNTLSPWLDNSFGVAFCFLGIVAVDQFFLSRK